MSKESLTYDAQTGVVVAMGAAGVSFTISTILNFYKSKDLKLAVQQSIGMAAASGAKSFAVYLISTQAQRAGAINSTLSKAINIDFSKIA